MNLTAAETSELKNTSIKKKRIVAVGAGGRIPMFIDPIARDYKENCELLALCDISMVRMQYHKKRLQADYSYPEIKLYPAEQFDLMLREQQPDIVIVCTMDATHHHYIIRSVESGCDVICEKPLTTDAEKCKAIVDAVRRTQQKVRVTFNYRWSPGVSRLRELIRDGAIGSVKHIQMEYLLDTNHGADYFRRWHSEKSCSGGLLVHKSTHHFDLVNWIADLIPETVYATGNLVYYGKANAIARGDERFTGYDRYIGNASSEDPFLFDLNASEDTKELYLKAESESGYIRDRNVFRDNIDIEDTMSVIVNYRSGVVLNYSLNAYCPWEGFRVAFNGDKGRIEFEEVHRSHVIRGQSDSQLAAEQSQGEKYYTIRYLPLFEAEQIIRVPKSAGGHGGGDPLIQEQMFGSNPPKDVLGRNAQYEQGAASALIGIAANKSIATGIPVKISDLVDLAPQAKHLSELS